MPAKPREVLAPMAERLDAARKEVKDDAAALADSRRRRDRLIRDAVDEGMSQRKVAAAVGMTVPRVSAILGTPDDDEVDDA